MIRPLFVASLLWLCVFCVQTPAAFADEFRHEARVMGRMGNHPNVVQFFGAVSIEVTIKASAIGDNPLYEDQTVVVDNPLYESSADPGTPGSVESISMVLDNTEFAPKPAGGGIVHRDIAARNVLIQTNGGIYMSGADEFVLFGSDAPASLKNVGPIRWMAPESLRLHRSGATDPNDWIELAEFSFFTVNYVPEPTAGLLAMMGGLFVAPRRASRC